MILVNIVGGLGNQLYIYSIGRKLALLNNTELYYSNLYVESYKLQHQYRGDSISQFNIVAKIKNDSVGLTHINDNTTVSRFNPDILKLRGNYYLTGYWQSWKYFHDIRDTLIKDFTLKNGLSECNKAFEQKILNTNSVSFHVRRGDKVQENKLKRFPFYGVDYFEKAKKIIESKVSNPEYFIFSDDIAWCRNSIKGSNVTFVDTNIDKVWEDMILMKICKHNIIPASSLSWWAAYLNENINKIVITPRIWYNDLQYDITDFNLQGWIEL